MTFKKPNCFLFLLLVSLFLRPGDARQECIRQLRPKSMALRGSMGKYWQNLTDYPVNLKIGAMMADSMAMIFNPPRRPPNTITFAVVQTVPFVFGYGVDWTAGYHFVWGPLYSIVDEAAKKYNYSLEGINLAGRSILNAGFKYMPDISMSSVFAHLKAILMAFDDSNPARTIMGTLGPTPALSRFVSVEMIDCIAYRKELYQPRMFGFIAFIEVSVKWLFGISIIMTALVLASFKLRKLLFYLHRVAESLVGLDSPFESRFYGMFVLWVTVYWFFQQLLGGDMFSEMAAPAIPKIIDSWDDLAANPHLQILTATPYGEAKEEAVKENMTFTDMAHFGFSALIDFAKTKRSEYFGRQTSHYQDFTSRLKIYSVTEFSSVENGLYKLPDGSTLDMTTFDGDRVMMTMCEFLRYRCYTSFCAKEHVHVSKKGGEMMPYFFYVNGGIERAKLAAVNEVTVRLNEAGIYQRWLLTNTFDLKENSLKPQIFEYSDGELNNFKGPLLLFIAMSFNALAVACFEILIEKVLIVVATGILLFRFNKKQMIKNNEIKASILNAKPVQAW